MTQRPLLPLPDYQRIYQVAYGVLDASGIAVTHRACLFFASVGTLLLREQYKLPATLSAGCLALMVDEQKANVVVYGRAEGDDFVNDSEAFHAWVECDGWLIDFMAPIMGIAVREDGHQWKIPPRMLQKRLTERKHDLRAIQHAGEFYLRHDRGLTEALLDEQGVQFEDLIKASRAWFRRPPKPLNELALADTHGPTRRLIVRGPAIEGAW